MPEWSAEVTLDEASVRRLLADRFPALSLERLRPLAEGWDNAVWLADDTWVFRFPRRALAVPGIEREMAILPALASHLPLPVPDPVFQGRLDGVLGWPFFGSRMLDGEEAAEAALTDEDRAELAPELGRFLHALHGPAPAVELGGGVPLDPMGRADMATRVPRTLTRLAEVERLGLWRAPASVRVLLDRASALPRSGRALLVHGDLHARHVLVRDRRIAGIIDWGDLCRGDPSIDLHVYWSFFPPAARPAFERAYGPIAQDQLVRARVLALFLSATLAVYAHDLGLAGLADEAIGGLERASDARVDDP